MAKKDQEFSLPGDLGHDFDRQRDILTFRPVIRYVEPEPLEDDLAFEPEDVPPTIDEARQEVQDLIDSYDATKKLAEQAQRRIDNRVKQAGGVVVKLDPVKDAMVIAAMKRQFPDKEDPTKLDYECYKKCLKDLSAAGPTPPTVSDADIKAAKADPLRTAFGGSDKTAGENRPEISSPMNTVNPIDLSAFQAAGVIALFALMLPLIQGADAAAISKHMLSAKHV